SFPYWNVPFLLELSMPFRRAHLDMSLLLSPTVRRDRVSECDMACQRNGYPKSAAWSEEITAVSTHLARSVGASQIIRSESVVGELPNFPLSAGDTERRGRTAFLSN